jgi:spore maturation protein CgeB
VLKGADLVLVHEWNDTELVTALADYRRSRGGFVLFFHDTHHRAVAGPRFLSERPLSKYDGILAYGASLARIYREAGLRSWVWHEAADTRVFRPIPEIRRASDAVWIGNWGDDERANELRTYLFQPIARLVSRAAFTASAISRKFSERKPQSSSAAN